MQKTPIEVFSTKAEKYASYRWSYAPEAIQAIFDHTGVSRKSRIADIGAGTGILTWAFVGKVGQVFAVEPNPEMRAVAIRDLGSRPDCQVVNGRAEATTLDSQTIDLVTAAQSVHWFEPEEARREFYRILKPGGWMAFCRNYGMDVDLGEALKEVYPNVLQNDRLKVGKHKPINFYFKESDPILLKFPFDNQLRWEAFLGALSTASYAPDEGSSLYEHFACRVREVFDNFCIDGRIPISGITELYLGQF